ncbi:MAG: excinuclease ABC subunit C [Planctomycetales bacterium 4484_113]|nr:MAG: excinuclease ABC subunit C [Planctomycetales bacterium 4484_113]
MQEKWEKVLSSLPAATGVYEFKDRHGRILYIGKAVDIRARVRQYFSGSDSRGGKTRQLVRSSADVSYILTESEFDALVLEANLIKQFKPDYNVMMKDDKSFPYVHLTNERFPRVVITRRYRPESGSYWGPYTSLRSVRATVKFAAGLFGVRTCKLEIDGKRKYPKPCLDYHLKLCSAPCVDYVTREDYIARCQALSEFFNGKYVAVRELLEERMRKASQRQAYEQAARYRDLLRHLEKVEARTQVAGKPGDELDAIGFTTSGETLMVLVLQVRNGRLIGDREFVLQNELEQSRQELLANFLKLYYFHSTNSPRDILLPFAPADMNLITEFLSLQKKAKVALTLPRRGYKREILQMAATNARERLRSYLLKAPRRKEPGKAEDRLAELLGLPAPPQRIEGYDISNIQGRQAAGAMVRAQWLSSSRAVPSHLNTASSTSA